MGKAFRFLSHAEEPLQAGFAHPDGRAFHGPGEEVDGGTHADGHGHAGVAEIHGEPFFLLRAAKGDEEDVGLGLADALADASVIHLIHRGEGR